MVSQSAIPSRQHLGGALPYVFTEQGVAALSGILHSDKLIVLDEIQRMPDLFMTLRGLIDRNRLEGRTSGQFLLLGSASADLLRQSSESLAGRIRYLKMGGLNLLEINKDRSRRNDLWLRGGFPHSYLSSDDGLAMDWLEGIYLAMALRWRLPNPDIWPIAEPIPPGRLIALAVIGLVLDVSGIIGQTQGIAYGAHVGGFIGGVILGATVIPRRGTCVSAKMVKGSFERS